MADKKLFQLPVLTPVNGGPNLFATYPLLFALLFLFQMCFGRFGVIQTPEKIKRLFSQPLFRIVLLYGIAFTATANLETAGMATFVFVIVMHLFRTQEEKNEMGGQYF